MSKKGWQKINSHKGFFFKIKYYPSSTIRIRDTCGKVKQPSTAICVRIGNCCLWRNFPQNRVMGEIITHTIVLYHNSGHFEMSQYYLNRQLFMNCSTPANELEKRTHQSFQSRFGTTFHRKSKVNFNCDTFSVTVLSLQIDDAPVMAKKI